MQSNNVIFLDIDGVLLPFGSYNWVLDKVFAKPYNYLDRLVKRTVAVPELRRLAEEKDAKFVLISTWRYLFDDAFLHRYLVGIGLGDMLHTEWIAKSDAINYRAKDADVHSWLTEQNFTGEWWIVDDSDTGVPSQHWIRTDPYKGYKAGEYE